MNIHVVLLVKTIVVVVYNDECRPRWHEKACFMLASCMNWRKIFRYQWQNSSIVAECRLYIVFVES